MSLQWSCKQYDTHHFHSEVSSKNAIDISFPSSSLWYLHVNYQLLRALQSLIDTWMDFLKATLESYLILWPSFAFVVCLHPSYLYIFMHSFVFSCPFPWSNRIASLPFGSKNSLKLMVTNWHCKIHIMHTGTSLEPNQIFCKLRQMHYGMCMMKYCCCHFCLVEWP